MRKRSMIWPVGLLALLAGCADAGGAGESSAPSATPASSQSSAQSSSPPSPSPSAFRADADAMPPQCGDEYVVHLNTNPLVPSTSFPFEGSDEQVLAQAAPRGDFAIPAALDGLIVSCVVTMYAPVDASANADGSPRIGALSIALLGNDNVNGPAPGAHLDWWRTANGYAPPGGDIAGPQVYSQPLAADGSQTRTIYFNGVDPAMAPQLSDLTGVEIDPFGAFVVLTDYTIAQP